MIAIRMRGVGRYFGPRFDFDGPERPREAFQTLLRVAGFDVGTATEDEHVQRTVAVSGHVLRGVTLDIEQGSVVCLTGPSGSGKTVLLQILGGEVAPTAGTVEIYAPVRSLVSLGANVEERQTASENIQASPEYLGSSPADAARYASEVIEFAGLHGFEDAPLRTYSTGMLMRLSVGMALSGRPSIVLIDDVLTVGDIAFQAKCVDRVHALKEQGCTIVAAFSDESLVHDVATRVVTLNGGQVVSDTPGRQWMQVREASSAADVEWQVLRSLPEDDVMRVRSVAVEAGEDGGERRVDVFIGLEAKMGSVRCRPSVFVMSGRTVVFRTVYPEFLDVAEPKAFMCRVRIPTGLLSNGTYTLTISIMTLRGRMAFSIKSEDAVTLTVRRQETPSDDAARVPILAVQLPWDIERVGEARA